METPMLKAFKHFKDRNGTDTTVNALQFRFAQPVTDENTTLHFGNGAAVEVKATFEAANAWLLAVE
jgi:hypothetical protein